MIKSPVELIVGTLRQFRFETGEMTPFLLVSRQLGQDLFAPPNVKGWPGGEAWINSATLLARKQLLESLFRAREMRPAPMAMNGDTGNVKAGDNVSGIGNLGVDNRQRFARALMDINFDGDKWLSQFRPGDPVLTKVVLASEAVSAPAAGVTGIDLLRQMVLDPAYQLK